ncbi:MAG: rRNA pseudouridine synthase [Gemmatimonadota bacterium]|nr:rRNA pseudouridine synthase [Gemmatimonadota bacterium]
MKFVKYLANLGYGTRRDVLRMFEHGEVTDSAGTLLSANDAFVHDDVLVDGELLDPPPNSALIFNKPVGYVCSAKEASALIYELLPPRFRKRSPIMAPVGRLDRDTSGLLLLTDDGQLNHRVTSPKSGLPKVYHAELASELRGDERELFASGTLLLESETEALKPAELQVLGPRSVRVTLTEGRYHHVRRMFAAVGNHVESLHRVSIGAVQLGELKNGHWRLLNSEERFSLSPRLRDSA